MTQIEVMSSPKLSDVQFIAASLRKKGISVEVRTEKIHEDLPVDLPIYILFVPTGMIESVEEHLEDIFGE